MAYFCALIVKPVLPALNNPPFTIHKVLLRPSDTTGGRGIQYPMLPHPSTTRHLQAQLGVLLPGHHAIGGRWCSSSRCGESALPPASGGSALGLPGSMEQDEPVWLVVTLWAGWVCMPPLVMWKLLCPTLCHPPTSKPGRGEGCCAFPERVCRVLLPGEAPTPIACPAFSYLSLFLTSQGNINPT